MMNFKQEKVQRTFLLLAIISCLSPQLSYGWGRRGHATVATTAAYLLAQDTKYYFLKFRSYDLSYYANIPDFIWKSTPEMYRQEKPQHFVGIEIFRRGIKASGMSAEKVATSPPPSEWLRDRQSFQKKYPQIPEHAGWAYWRVHELTTELSKVAADLKTHSGSPIAAKHELQARWLLLAGTIGHYIGDLSQPMHCTENYDGQMTKQNGLHSYFEDQLVDEYFPQLDQEVQKKAKALWPKFSQSASKLDAFQLAQNLCEDSLKQLPKLLATDKRVGRRELKKAAAAHKAMILQRLAQSSLYLAEIWRRNLDWSFSNEKFYNFIGTPEYIKAPPYVGNVSSN